MIGWLGGGDAEIIAREAIGDTLYAIRDMRYAIGLRVDRGCGKLGAVMPP